MVIVGCSGRSRGRRRRARAGSRYGAAGRVAIPPNFPLSLELCERAQWPGGACWVLRTADGKASSGVDKPHLSERHICADSFTPAIVKPGRDVDTQLREEVCFIKCRIIAGGKPVSTERTKRAALETACSRRSITPILKVALPSTHRDFLRASAQVGNLADDFEDSAPGWAKDFRDQYLPALTSVGTSVGPVEEL